MFSNKCIATAATRRDHAHSTRLQRAFALPYVSCSRCQLIPQLPAFRNSKVARASPFCSWHPKQISLPTVSPLLFLCLSLSFTLHLSLSLFAYGAPFDSCTNLHKLYKLKWAQGDSLVRCPAYKFSAFSPHTRTPYHTFIHTPMCSSLHPPSSLFLLSPLAPWQLLSALFLCVISTNSVDLLHKHFPFCQWAAATLLGGLGGVALWENFHWQW